MPYLNYDEYKEFGGTAAEPGFTLLEFKARKRIDYLTDSRVVAMKEAPEAVKLCMTSLINVESRAGLEVQIENPVVTSFTTDGYSETYGHVLSAADVEKMQGALIVEMLSGECDDEGTPLLYRGLR